MDFTSKYSNGKRVTPAQYLVEFICERIAKIKKKDLHYRFWLSKEWSKEYRGQIAAANNLLSRYDIKIILQALKSTKGSKIYSLRAPHLIPIIESTSPIALHRSEKKIDRSSMGSRGKTESQNKNIIDRIKDLENGT